MKNICVFILMLAITACKKEPGIGGDGEITGKVWVKDYNGSFTNVIGEYPGEDEYVYIVFGENTGYDRRIKTDYNGDFRFSFLYPGDYKVYAYSSDTTGTQLDGQYAVIMNVKLDGRKDNKNIGLITIAK